MAHVLSPEVLKIGYFTRNNTMQQKKRESRPGAGWFGVMGRACSEPWRRLRVTLCYSRHEYKKIRDKNESTAVMWDSMDIDLQGELVPIDRHYIETLTTFEYHRFRWLSSFILYELILLVSWHAFLNVVILNAWKNAWCLNMKIMKN